MRTNDLEFRPIKQTIVFSKALQEIMSEQKLSQSQLSRILGIRQSQISNWLNGKSLPTYVSLELLKTKLKVDMRIFFDN